MNKANRILEIEKQLLALQGELKSLQANDSQLVKTDESLNLPPKNKLLKADKANLSDEQAMEDLRQDIAYLQKSDFRLRRIIESIPEVIFETDTEGNWLFLNQEWELLSGYKFEESIGKNMFDFVNRERQEMYQASFRKFLSSKQESCKKTYQFIKKNNGFLWVEINCRVLQDETDTIIGTYGVLRDVTAQQQEQNFQDALARITLRLTGFPVEMLPGTLDMALIEIGQALNADRAYIFEFTENSTMTNTYEWCNVGISPEKDNLINIPTSVYPNWMETLSRPEMIIIPSVAQMEESWSEEKKALEPQGIKSLIVIPLVLESKVIGFFGLDSVKAERSFNETEMNYLSIWGSVMSGLIKQRRAEELRKVFEIELIKAKGSAEKANIAKSEFLSRMSHELRTPMNSILGFAQLLEMDDLRKSQVVCVQHILKSGRHLLNLINEVLDIARIESGKAEMLPVKIDLGKVIQEMQAMFHNSFVQKQLQFKLSFQPGEDFHIMADMHRIKQVIINLLSNAVKYNSERGIIEMSVNRVLTQRKEVIRMAVKDSGKGITTENLTKIFSPFERLDAAFSTIEGTGLGLSIVKQIVESLGGNVGVESTIGEGSVFWIDLPALTVSPQSVDALESNAGQVLYQPGTILYIEDNQSNIDIVAQTLRMLRPNIEMIASHTGHGTVPLALKHNPALVLLDLNLPDIQGDQVIDILYNEPTLRHIPIVVISANAMHETIQLLQKKRIAAYLTKPVDLEQLLAIIDKHTTPLT